MQLLLQIFNHHEILRTSWITYLGGRLLQLASSWPAPLADDIATLQEYAQGVMARSEHHANAVGSIALALMGAVIWRADPGSIRIRKSAKGLANMLWADVGAKTYVFGYNHGQGTIEMKDRTQTGAILHSFSNRTPVTDIEAM